MRQDTRTKGALLVRLCAVTLGLLGVSTPASLGQHQQSPIDINNAVLLPVQVLPGLNFQYANSPAKLKNPGFEPPKPSPPFPAPPVGTPAWIDHAGLKVDFAPGNGGLLTVNAQDWTLDQIHFHAHGEHRLAGQASAMEMHMVHTRNVGAMKEILVVGRWMDVGPGGNYHPNDAMANLELSKIINNDLLNPPLGVMTPAAPPPGAPPSVDILGGFNPSALLPAVGSRQSYRYNGSLTVPEEKYIPVNWIIFHEKLTITNVQLATFWNYLNLIGRPNGNGHGPVVIGPGFAGVQNDVPTPGAAVLLGFAGVFAVRRRRVA